MLLLLSLLLLLLLLQLVVVVSIQEEEEKEKEEEECVLNIVSTVCENEQERTGRKMGSVGSRLRSLRCPFKCYDTGRASGHRDFPPRRGHDSTTSHDFHRFDC